MAGGSKTAVYVAITANSLVTVAKFIGFGLTGSGAMLSEGIHSAADVGNQTLLAIGLKKSQAPEDEDHPFGYGREAFIWSLISAVGIFFLGCGVTLTHGFQSLLGGHGDHGHGAHEAAASAAAHAGGDQLLNLGILIFAFVIEGASLLIAMKGINDDAKKADMTFLEYLKKSDDPFGVAIIMEDSAAVLGVVFALVAVGLNYVTGEAYWDAIGSISIGFLLGFVALFLIAKNRSLLIGKAIREQDQRMLMQMLKEDPLVDDVEIARATVQGADSYRISAELEFNGAILAQKYLDTHELEALYDEAKASPEAFQAFLERYSDEVMDLVGDEVDRLEAKIREKLPKAKHLALEPD